MAYILQNSKVLSSVLYHEYSFLGYYAFFFIIVKGKVPNHIVWNGVFLIERKGVMGQFVAYINQSYNTTKLTQQILIN